MGSVARMTEPYRALMEGKWKEAVTFYETNAESLQASLTVNGDTAVHMAVYIRNMKLLRNLLNILESQGTDPIPTLGAEGVEEIQPLRVKDIHGQTALHLAAAYGDLEALDLLLENDAELLTIMNKNEETPLFLAASHGQTKAVRYLFPKIKEKQSPIKPKRKDKTPILHLAILGEYFETALELLKWDDDCRRELDENGTTGFQLLANMPSAFKSGYRMGKFKKLLYYCLPNVDYPGNDDKESDGKAEATSSWRNKKDIETGNKMQGQQPSNQQSTAGCPSGVSGVYNTFWKCMARAFPTIQTLWREKTKHNKALELAKNLAEKDFSWKHGNFGGAPSDEAFTLKSDLLGLGVEEMEAQTPQSGIAAGKNLSHSKKEEENAEQEGDGPPKYFESSYLDETPFIAAARNGILEIVKAILDLYPPAIENINKKNENIFHVVARHRRAEILDYLQSSSNVPRSRLRKMIDIENGDSILHCAAYLSTSLSRDRPGEALHMQSDLQWFERIEKIVPKYFINHRNRKNWTAQELFTEQHKQLVEDGQKWLKRTAEACTIVAVLIATVAFTCIYTVPGGSTDTGRPLLLNATPFSAFATSDALSLCLSLTSVVVFLSIITSKMNEQDFRRSLPSKLVLGLTTLFLSVAFMMVAFSATLLLMLSQRLHWAAIPIYTVACCPVTIFLLLQLPLYINISWFILNDFFAANNSIT